MNRLRIPVILIRNQAMNARQPQVLQLAQIITTLVRAPITTAPTLQTATPILTQNHAAHLVRLQIYHLRRHHKKGVPRHCLATRPGV